MYGFGYVFCMFSCIIVVIIGSGIGLCLFFLVDENRFSMRVLWQMRSLFKIYGQRMLDLVSRMDQNFVIIDMSEKGKREEMLLQVLRLVKEFDVEVVCVISNLVVMKEVVFELEMRGILVYGFIFDSQFGGWSFWLVGFCLCFGFGFWDWKLQLLVLLLWVVCLGWCLEKEV